MQGPVARMQLAQSLVADLLALARAEKNLVLSDSTELINRFDAEITQTRQTLVGHRDQLLAIASDEGKKRLAVFETAWQRYLGTQDRVRTLGNHDTLHQARDLARDEGQPALDQATGVLRQLADSRR